MLIWLISYMIGNLSQVLIHSNVVVILSDFRSLHSSPLRRPRFPRRSGHAVLFRQNEDGPRGVVLGVDLGHSLFQFIWANEWGGLVRETDSHGLEGACEARWGKNIGLHGFYFGYGPLWFCKQWDGNDHVDYLVAMKGRKMNQPSVHVVTHTYHFQIERTT